MRQGAPGKILPRAANWPGPALIVGGDRGGASGQGFFCLFAYFVFIINKNKTSR